MLRRRRVLCLDEGGWERRTIMVVGSRSEVRRICDGWTAEGWQVMTVDTGAATPAGHATHVVRVAVPPPGWQSSEELLEHLERQA